MDTPAADIAIDPELVARLVAAQHPDLAGRLRLVANGWDNAIYRLGEKLCVRLPRRRVAAGLIRNEQRWLPRLAGRLGVPVPEPVRVGAPSDEYPWPWTIGPWFTGRLATDLTPADRGQLATGLADFVIALHIPAPADAPRSPVRGVPLAERDPVVRERLASGVIPSSDELRAIWDEAVATPAWGGPPLWVHGDLHPANILVETSDARLAAILDFGDLTGGDPATDLAVAWFTFDADGRAAFRERVDADPDTWTRARGWALNMASSIAEHSADNPRMAAIARHTLTQVLRDDLTTSSPGRRLGAHPRGRGDTQLTTDETMDLTRGD